MCNAIASTIFCARNLKKAKDNPIRGGVAVANGTKVAGAVSHSTAMKTASNIAGKIVNPLLVASCIYQTAKADDKLKEGVSNAGGLAGMFFFEKQMKNGKLGELATKGATKLMSFVSKNAKTQTVGANILTGLAFVAASIGGWTLGQKTGEKAIDLIRKGNPPKEQPANELELNQANHLELMA